MEMNVIATHTIKPSSPTSVESKTHELSSLDHVAPTVYIPLIFFYQNPQSIPHSDISRNLRRSLSAILTIYYPLAGTKHNSFVDCNDIGAEFLEARVHASLHHFIQAPKVEEIDQLVPVDCSSYDDNAPQLLVKLSYFDCGGISVGVCFSHRIGDASSFVGFMNAWAATCRSETPQIIHPSFNLARHFPPTVQSASFPGFRQGMTKLKMTTRRFVFDGEKVEKLRKKHHEFRPSRVEAVSAFIWGSFIDANKTKTSSSTAFHAVNLRPRTAPPLPDQTFGNCHSNASAVVRWEEDDNVSDEVLVSKLRAAIRTVDDEYISRVVKDESYIRVIQEAGDSVKVGDLIFTSWVRFPAYEVNFGWGKPDWVCPATTLYMNIVILMSTADGDGVEAWINFLDEGYFQFLETSYNNLFTSST